jgi:hypothetical protein
MARCECGEPATVKGICARCAFLDGEQPTEVLIIEALRSVGCATMAQLAASCRCDRTNIVKRIRALEHRGRVRRFVPPADEDGRPRPEQSFVLIDAPA